MVHISELERHYSDDLNSIPTAEFVPAVQRALGLNAQPHPDISEYDALVSAPGEPAGTFEQRWAAGHLVDTLFSYTLNHQPGQEMQAPSSEFVRALFEEDQEAARRARDADPEHAEQYPAFTLEHALAAAQKRQTWLTGVLVQETDDDYQNATSIRAAIARQRSAYRLVEGAIGTTLQRNRHEALVAELALKEAELKERSPLLYATYQMLAWTLTHANRYLAQHTTMQIGLMSEARGTMMHAARLPQNPV